MVLSGLGNSVSVFVFSSSPASSSSRRLEAVHLELLGLDESGLGEPVADLVPLVALQLQHLAVLGVLHHCAVASKLLQKKRTKNESRAVTPPRCPVSNSAHLLACSHDLLEVVLCGEPLDGGQRLAPVALLDADVH